MQEIKAKDSLINFEIKSTASLWAKSPHSQDACQRGREGPKAIYSALSIDIPSTQSITRCIAASCDTLPTICLNACLTSLDAVHRGAPPPCGKQVRPAAASRRDAPSPV